MSFIGGILVATGVVALLFTVTAAVTVNLPASTALSARLAVIAFGALVAFLAGSAIIRRARRTRRHLPTFSGLACGVASGLIGSALAVGLTAAYVSVYGGWPAGTLDRVFLVLSYPAVAALGFIAAGVAGMVLGVLAGAVLKLAYLGR